MEDRQVSTVLATLVDVERVIANNPLPRHLHLAVQYHVYSMS